MPCRDPGSSRGLSDLQSDALATELSWLCAKLQMLLTTLVHNYIILFWVPVGKVSWVLAAVASGPRILSRDWCKGFADVRIHAWDVP